MAKQEPLVWMDEAFKYIGLREAPGPANNPTIVKWLTELKLPWRDDSTAWCAVFTSATLKRSNRGYPNKTPAWALSYNNIGTKLAKPAYGAIATKKRKPSGGHVFFVAGITENGYIVGLGGNQSDSVNLMLFNPKELTYIWPPLADGTKTVPTEARYKLPVYNSKTLKLSTKED